MAQFKIYQVTYFSIHYSGAGSAPPDHLAHIHLTLKTLRVLITLMLWDGHQYSIFCNR